MTAVYVPANTEEWQNATVKHEWIAAKQNVRNMQITLDMALRHAYVKY